jgi:GNAT superfamily N-acetyltransferase
MYILILSILSLILFSLFIRYKNNDNYICNHKKNLNESEIIIFEKYLKQEYETAHLYLRDDNILHFYILDNDVLISYFHIVKMDDTYDIYYMYTNKDYRRQGYITKLLKYSFDVCKKYNINILHTNTKKYNIPSINNILNNGFSILEEKNDMIYFYKNI